LHRIKITVNSYQALAASILLGKDVVHGQNRGVPVIGQKDGEGHDDRHINKERLYKCSRPFNY
jgi:hypothetical protein